MIDKYKGTYRIPSARFAPHNYNEGTFFVTICTHERKQTRFHDHIIRDTGAFETIMNYVLTNVENWHKDCFLTDSQM